MENQTAELPVQEQNRTYNLDLTLAFMAQDDEMANKIHAHILWMLEAHTEVIKEELSVITEEN